MLFSFPSPIHAPLGDDAPASTPASGYTTPPKSVDATGWDAQTAMVRGGLARSANSETSEALYLNSGYVYGAAEEAEAAFDGSMDRFVYSRFANPTVGMFEARLALLEQAKHCRATASGMAAVTAAILSQVRTGDRVVAARELFGSCSWVVGELLPRYGVEIEFVAAEDDAAWEVALSRPAKAVFVESPSNPNLRVADLRLLAKLSKAAGARLVVDNAFASPALQNPLVLGADIVIHSATKFIDGQGRGMGGAVLTNDDTYLEEDLVPFLRHTGPCIAPFNAWMMLKGLETLGIRMDRHCSNALAVARFLEAHPAVAAVHYPGLESHPKHAVAMGQMSQGGAVLAFDLHGGKEAAFHLLNHLGLIDISNNLGDAKSLACHPATTTHQRLDAEEKDRQGITPGLIRISVGLEAEPDLLADLERALAGLS